MIAKVKFNVFMFPFIGEEGVPIQVDGEAWTQPPGIVRIVHKNRVQMLCRNRVSMNSILRRKAHQHITLLYVTTLPVL